MRKLILSIQTSLDGFIEGPDGDMSWVPTQDDELWDDLFNMLEDVDLFVMGRGMYKDYRNYWVNALTDPKATPNEVKYARLADRTPHIVFSKTLHDPLWANTTVLPGSIVDTIRHLKQQSGKSIQIVAGAQFATTLMNSGLVDEYRLNILPIMVTKGKSIYRDLTAQRPLRLLTSHITKAGVIIARYVPSLPYPA